MTRCSAPRAWSRRSTGRRGSFRKRSAPSAFSKSKPGSPNVVPGEVFLTMDLRDPDAAVIDRMENEIAAQARGIGSELGLEIAIKTISAEPAVQFDPGCIAAVRAAAANLRLFRPRHDLARRP